MKWVKIGISNIEFEIKPVQIKDFLDHSTGFPITFFKKKNSYGMFEKIKKEIGEKEEVTEKELKKRIELVEVVLEKCVKDYSSHENLKNNLFVFYELYNQILLISFTLFDKVIEINNVQLDYFDMMAKRYGKLPIEILCTNGEYTEADAYIFNSCILNEAIRKENVEAQKRRLKSRKR
jgi:hypothetical protein